jgi:hypothetical protein
MMLMPSLVGLVSLLFWFLSGISIPQYFADWKLFLRLAKYESISMVLQPSLCYFLYYDYLPYLISFRVFHASAQTLKLVTAL